MRNLKRALSLLLSSTMVLGMLVMGSSAASYTDVTSEENVEAIEVLKAVGVMTGDENGNFNPNKQVTRAEMAVVMANLLDLKVEDFKGASLPFTDVPEWAVPYVAACYADGITAGISATQYGSNNSVTTAQAALMMMKALGYFQYSRDFGSDWQVATVKQGSKINLFDGIEAGASAAMTRNDVAQLALNTLKSTMVETDGSSTSITLPGGIVIDSGDTKYEEITNSDSKYAAIDNAKDGDKYYVQLGEKLFDGKLEKKAGADDAGRPGSKWVYDKKNVGTYGEQADYVVTLEKKYTADEVTNVEKTEKILQDLTGNDDLKFHVVEGHQNNDVRFWINGKDLSKGANKPSAEDMAKRFEEGTVLELFCEGDDITDIIVLDYEIAKIQDVSTSLTKAQKEDGATCKIKVDGKYYLDIDVANFDSKTYVEDAYILFAANDETTANDMLASQIAESVKGEVEATKGSDVRIDGTYYTDLTEEIKVGDKGTFYLNMAGQIAAVDTTAAKSDNYGYIYSVIRSGDDEVNEDGLEKNVCTVYMVLADGTKVSYDVDKDSVEKLPAGDKKGTVAYSINSDKELVIETPDDTQAGPFNAKIDKDNVLFGTQGDNKYRATSETQFIFAYQDGNKMKTSVSTGYKNVSIESSANIYVYADEDGYALYAFVDAKNGSLTSDELLAVLLDSEPSISKVDGDKIFTYTVAIDGEETELSFKSELASSIAEGDAFNYVMDGDYAKDANETDIKSAEVVANNADYIILNNGARFNWGTETIYTITLEYKDEAAYDEGKIDTVSVSEGGKIDQGDKVVYTVDGEDLDVIFVYEYVY